MANYKWKSEKQCAYFALRELENRLDQSEEYGTTIFRWPDPEGGYFYSYQQPTYAGTEKNWRPLGRIPAGTEEWAQCHTHPNGSYFSTDDTAWARGESGYGIIKRKFTIYMVNRKGGYWYDGATEFLSHDERFGTLYKN